MGSAILSLTGSVNMYTVQVLCSVSVQVLWKGIVYGIYICTGTMYWYCYMYCNSTLTGTVYMYSHCVHVLLLYTDIVTICRCYYCIGIVLCTGTMYRYCYCKQILLLVTCYWSRILHYYCIHVSLQLIWLGTGLCTNTLFCVQILLYVLYAGTVTVYGYCNEYRYLYRYWAHVLIQLTSIVYRYWYWWCGQVLCCVQVLLQLF